MAPLETGDKIMTAISGVLPVLQLPYGDDDAIDWHTLGREVDWAFANGAQGVVAAMVTEILRLTDAERDELAARMVVSVNGRGPVVMSVGAESAWQAIGVAQGDSRRHGSTPPACRRCGAPLAVHASPRPVFCLLAPRVCGGPCEACCRLIRGGLVG